ncbi:MAG: hypothetical protein ACFE9Z_09445 [Promethearchaeota archaeon]
MRENNKYNNYRFIGKINVDEIQPWFDFTTAKPWDDPEVPWVLDNKVRREILIELSKNPKNFEEIYETINFRPKPLLITEKEYLTNISYQWMRETLENHLLSLEWYNLIRVTNGKYELTIPILTRNKLDNLEAYVVQFAKSWIDIIKKLIHEIQTNIGKLSEKDPLLNILIDKAVEELYSLLKEENLISKEPNLKALWAEELRKIKFEDWISKNF